jgi:DNA-binding protein HU-beta
MEGAVRWSGRRRKDRSERSGGGGYKPSKFFDFLVFSPCSDRVNAFNTRRSQDSTHTLKATKQTNNYPMAKALSKSQIATAIAEKAAISKKQASEILEHIAQLAYKNAKNTFTLPGLGKLVLVNRKARQGRNPMTGETIQIPAKRVVKFRVAKAAKDAILGAK